MKGHIGLKKAWARSVELKEYLCHCIFGYLTFDHHFYEIACGHDYS
jgi:hypothetical protein